jgi:dienelactone hydrolase
MNDVLFSRAGVFAAPADGGARVSRHAADMVPVADREVRVDLFEPDVPGGGETVLLLHGVGGLLGDGALMRRGARFLAARGLRAGVVHYFNATGTLFATQANARQHIGEWREALTGITRFYAATRHAPVGLFGYSLGGALAVGVGQEVEGVDAVAAMAAGVLEGHEPMTPAHAPALLVLHGAEDVKVPPEHAEALVRLGRRAGLLVESVIYPREGHSFGSRAERDAFARAAEFFVARLGAGAEH